MTTPLGLTSVDHLVVAVRDLAAAEAEYGSLLCATPTWRGAHPAHGTRNVIFGLANCYLELLAPVDGATEPLATILRAYLAARVEGLFAVALATADIDSTHRALTAAGLTQDPVTPGEAVSDEGTRRGWRSLILPRDRTRGVSTIVIQHDDAAMVPRAAAMPADPSAVFAVDHVVIFSDDIEAALHLWRDVLGIEERWRREFPQRGTVNIGLRLGHLTLELVAPLGNAAGERGERLWGIAYAVGDCDAAVARVRAAGIATTDVRDGLAPATRIATVKWPDRVATLLLQHTRPRMWFEPAEP